jgi:PAS domain S-box-containing protein
VLEVLEWIDNLPITRDRTRSMQNKTPPSENRLGLAEQHAGFGVWDLDIAHATVHYSPHWKAQLGYAPTDTADTTATWRGRVHPDDLQPMVDALNAHLGGHTPDYEHEFRLRAADDHYRWVLSRGCVVERDADGRALRAVGTLVDLTRRQAQSEVDGAEAVRRAEVAMLRRVSQELRSPLNAVLGFAQLALHDSAIEQQRVYAAHIEQAGWQLLKRIDELLSRQSPPEKTTD